MVILLNQSSSGLHIREDLARQYADLFGEKKVNDQTVRVEDWITRLTTEFGEDFRAITRMRHEFLKRQNAVTERYAFLPSDRVISDADGNKLTVGQIRQGMLDNFFNEESPSRWKLNKSIPVPDEVTRPGLQGTGPFDDLGMAMSALNARTASWMPDWEDAGNDYQDKLYRAWKNLKELLAGEWDGQTYVHPTKKKQYRIGVPRESWPTFFIRVPGLHLTNRQMTVGGKPVPAIIPALLLHALNNYDSQRRHKSGIYYYAPKIETPEEALLVARLLKAVEAVIGVSRGTIKIEMLNERARYSVNQEAIMWVLRDWLVGPNVGRWDYINSRIEMGRDHRQLVFPDPHKVTMTDPTMTAYTRRNALLTTLVHGFPVGGMSAVMKNSKQSKEVNHKAIRSIWFDKLRERLTGLLLIDGTLFDCYRQSWVATTENEYVRAGEEPLIAQFAEGKGSPLQDLVDRATSDERKVLENLNLLRDGKIHPYTISKKDLTVENLFSDQAWDELFSLPRGETTEEGLRYAITMATEYMFQQLNGNNAVAIDDYLSGTRLMNDFATYEIFWHWLWTTLHHQQGLSRGGKTTQEGERVNESLMSRLLEERWRDVEAYFSEQDRQGIVSRFDRSKAPLVMEVIRRQLFHSQWIMYGSRVLLSIIEADEKEREQTLTAIFSPSRAEVVGKVETGELSPTALAAYDYVYDIPQE